MKAKISEAEELQLPMFYLDDNKNIVKNLYNIVDNYIGEYKYEVIEEPPKGNGSRLVFKYIFN